MTGSQVANSTGDKRRVLGTLGTTGGIAFASLVAGIVLARALGPAGRGTVAAFLAWSAVAVELALLGTQQATVFTIAGVTARTRTRADAWSRIARYSVAEAILAVVIFLPIAYLLPASELAFWLVAGLFALRAFLRRSLAPPASLSARRLCASTAST